MADHKPVNLECETVLNLLRTINKTPHVTQRELSSALGISLGKVNFLVKALIRKGLIKANNFKNSKKKAAYIYLLTPRGVEEKARITYHFLVQKTQEYERLSREIEKLRQEVGRGEITVTMTELI